MNVSILSFLSGNCLLTGEILLISISHFQNWMIRFPSHTTDNCTNNTHNSLPIITLEWKNHCSIHASIFQTKLSNFNLFSSIALLNSHFPPFLNSSPLLPPSLPFNNPFFFNFVTRPSLSLYHDPRDISFLVPVK